jgi:hypothetical protein
MAWLLRNIEVQKGTNGGRTGRATTAGTAPIMRDEEPQNKKKKANEWTKVKSRG